MPASAVAWSAKFRVTSMRMLVLASRSSRELSRRADWPVPGVPPEAPEPRKSSRRASSLPRQ